MAISRLRDVFEKVDRLYAEELSVSVKKLYDDLLVSIEKVVRERNRILGKSKEDVEKMLLEELVKINSSYERIAERTLTGYINRLTRLRELFKNIVNMLNDRLRTVSSERESLEAKAKALIRAGRADEAQAYTPTIVQLEKSIKFIKSYLTTLNRSIGRIVAIITGIRVLKDIAKIFRIDMSLLNREQLIEFIRMIRSSRETIENLEKSLTELQETLDISRGIPSAMLTEEERRVYQRLIDEVLVEGGIATEIKSQLEELKKKLKEKEKEVEEIYSAMKSS